MERIVITGTAGLLGPSVVEHFVGQGYDVLSVDLRKPENPLCPHVTADLTKLGECYGVLQGATAVVHLAAIPEAYVYPNEVTFGNNVMSTYNILEAAAGLGIRKAVTASSESSYGICFSRRGLSPQYVPIDEEHPQLPEDCYGLSKVVAEQIGAMMHRRCGMQVVALRIGNVITPERYRNFPGFQSDPAQRRMILWSYIDARDIASACELALKAEGLGAVAINLAADDTCMEMPSRRLMELEFPAVRDFREPLEGNETLLSNRRAKELLGWQPRYCWRDCVQAAQE